MNNSNKILKKIDLNIHQGHSCLTPEDECYFFSEYTAYGGYKKSEANQLILNFKKTVNRKAPPKRGFKYKAEAIETVASDLNNYFRRVPPNSSQGVSYLIVPVPPSKAHDDDEYDDRMTQVLNSVEQNLKETLFKPKLIELIKQKESTKSCHMVGGRLSAEELKNNYIIEEEYKKKVSVLEKGKLTILIFDDVLTTGAHFKAMQEKIVEELEISPNQIIGIFLSRCIFPKVSAEFIEMASNALKKDKQ